MPQNITIHAREVVINNNYYTTHDRVNNVESDKTQEMITVREETTTSDEAATSNSAQNGGNWINFGGRPQSSLIPPKKPTLGPFQFGTSIQKLSSTEQTGAVFDFFNKLKTKTDWINSEGKAGSKFKPTSTMKRASSIEAPELLKSLRDQLKAINADSGQGSSNKLTSSSPKFGFSIFDSPSLEAPNILSKRSTPGKSAVAAKPKSTESPKTSIFASTPLIFEQPSPKVAGTSTLKFKAPLEIEAGVKGETITTNQQNVGFMSEYARKSIEELRLEDYKSKQAKQGPIAFAGKNQKPKNP